MGFPFGLEKAKPKRPVFGSRFFYSVALHKKELHNASTGNPRFRFLNPQKFLESPFLLSRFL